MYKIFDQDIPVQMSEIPNNLKINFVLHQGRTYEAVGITEGKELSLGERTVHVLIIIALIVSSIFTIFIPFLFKDFRNELFSHIEELKINHMINVHYKQFQGDGEYIARAVANEIFGFGILY